MAKRIKGTTVRVSGPGAGDLLRALTAPVTVMREIDAERHRQITKEGFDAKHDDEHASRELARAAAAYVQHYFERQWLMTGNPFPSKHEQYAEDEPPDFWPWDEEWWKPKNPRRDLIRAAALIVAEIERLDRAAVGKT